MIIELVFLACLKTDPTKCDEYAIMGEWGAGIMQCMMAGPTEAVTFAEQKPELKIDRWFCRGLGEKDIEA